MSKGMRTVAQVCDLPPGDEQAASWINPGFIGVVREISEKQTKAGKPFWPCVIADMTGPETIEVSFFQKMPPFREGDAVEFSGKGLRRTDFNGKPQAAISKDTQIHVVGQSAHEPEQLARAAAGAPAVSGRPQLVPGPTVGAALNQAHEMFRFIYPADEMRDMVKQPHYWAAVHEFASDNIRVARLLEAGKLAKPIRERRGEAPGPEPTTTGRDYARPPNPQEPEEDNIPF